LLAREPMGSRKLAQLAGLADGTEARTLIRTLNRLYDEEGCAFRVVEVAGGWQLRSRAKFAPWLRRLCAAESEVRLSAPAMETLAVVAYRQPVLRADIEAIRGVQCGEVLRQLMERDLVRIAGRSEELGRPLLYGTSRHFLEVFGLRHLEELPRLNQLIHSSKTEGDSNVKIAADTKVVLEDGLAETSAALLENRLSLVAAKDDEEGDEDLDASEDEDDDDDEDEDDDLEDDDDDFEDDDWEEVEDDDEEAEDLDEEEEEPEEEEEEEEEEEDEEEDEDWEDEDWEDEEDEDWDEEEEEEEEDWE
jgi:segregation and condensation protein B